jgi:DNA-binding MarR family transcriptional regulator
VPELLLLRDLPRYEMLQEKAKRYPDLDAGAVEATLVLLRVASDVLEGMGAHFARNGISQGRYLALMMLDRPCTENGMLPSELAEKLGVTRATVTGLLDGLEKDVLISRQMHPEDRRAFCIQLTDKGREFLAALLPDHYRRIAGLMAHLNDEERHQLVALLAKVAQGQDALRDASWTPPNA